MEKFLKKEIIAPILILVISYIIFKIIKALVKKTFKLEKKIKDEKKKRTIMYLFINIFKIFIILIDAIMILDIFGIDAKSLLTSLGIFAAVIALALQDLIKDYIAGITIIIEGQYRIGDIIEVDGFKGEVTFLSLKTTKIKAYTGETKIIANHNVNNIINYSMNESLAIIDVSVSYEADLNKVELVLTDLCNKLTMELEDLKGPVQLLGVQELGSSAVIYRITCLTESMKHINIQRKILKEIKMELDKKKIEIPYPQVVIHNGK